MTKSCGGTTPQAPRWVPLAGARGARTLDEAVSAVEATLPAGAPLRVDRRLAREDDSAYLLVVLDTSGGRDRQPGPVENGPRLVTKATGEVHRLTVPDALVLAGQMPVVRGGV